MKKIILLFLMSCVASCTSAKPYSDIAATKIAIEYMTKANSAKTAPYLFNKSMQYYVQANKLLAQKENASAKKYLQLARTYAEKAEFKSRTKVSKAQREW